MTEKEKVILRYFERGKNIEANKMLDSLSDKEALAMLQKIVDKYGETQVKKDVYCIMQHLRAFSYQSKRKEIADFHLACSMCLM